MKTALIGSHGTGKSTTLNATGITPKIQEIARELIMNGYEQGTAEFQREVIKKQIEAENSMDEFITDRSVRDNLAYSRIISEELYQELLPLAQGQKYDKLFYMPIQREIIGDGIRPESRRFQKDIQDYLLQILQENGQDYIEVTGELDERVNTILSHYNE